MVSILYAVTAFACALVLIITTIGIRPSLQKQDPLDKAFLRLTEWIAAFCLFDCTWGVFASEVVMNDKGLLITSALFHLSAAFTPLAWLNYVLAYLGKPGHEKLYKRLFAGVFLAQAIVIFVSIPTKIVFYVNENGEYATGGVRRILFYAQFISYILIAVYCTVMYIGGKGRRSDGNLNRKSYMYVLMFVAAPILTGVFQLLAPDAPAYSIGYMLGCVVIESFVVNDILNKRLIEKTTLEASSRAKTEFLFNMSHDIRTPMNAILGYTDIGIRHSDDTLRVKDSFVKIKAAGGHLLNLINDILEMSRIESGKLELTNVPLDIREEVKTVNYMSNALAVPKSINFTSEMGEFVHPFVLGDELHINEVIINLISNAVKYTENGGKVRYRVTENGVREDGKVIYRFEIADNGIGISEEFQSRLFEPFSREETGTVSKTEGTGIGLSIVKKIVDAAGGKISVDSKKGEGSTFVVEIPFSVMSEKEIEAFKLQNERPVQSEENLSLSGKRVLLVEDNEMNREIAAEILNEAGLKVKTAEDGLVALKLFKQGGEGAFDFVLMDIQMPVMNGYEATRAIRELPYGKKVPIIALSANAFEDDRRKSVESGMNDHIAKPIDVKVLFDTLRALS